MAQLRCAITSTQPHGEFLQVEVTDTGPGIPPRQLERLFNAFEQLEASTARTHGGTGLGLNISRQLAKLMGGDLTVKSLAGDGTTFSLRLPHTRLEGAVEREDCEQPVAPSMDLRVLIVDDHEINRKAFSLMLRPFCGRIVTAKGAWPCPILIEHEDARMGDTLADALQPIALRHPACYTCHVEGVSCRT